MKYVSRGSGAIVVIGAIAILIAVTVVGLFILQKRSSVAMTNPQDTTQAVAKPTEKVQTSLFNASPTKTQIKQTDTTDAKIDTDVTDIDKSMQTINLDAISIDTGLNDQIGDLSE